MGIPYWWRTLFDDAGLTDCRTIGLVAPGYGLASIWSRFLLEGVNIGLPILGPDALSSGAWGLFFRVLGLCTILDLGGGKSPPQGFSLGEQLGSTKGIWGKKAGEISDKDVSPVGRIYCAEVSLIVPLLVFSITQGGVW